VSRLSQLTGAVHAAIGGFHGGQVQLRADHLERAGAAAAGSRSRKTPKLANNWKTKSPEELTDAEVIAMPDSST
jgi:DnaK suppressor protein